jgi:hypothetical protein
MALIHPFPPNEAVALRASVGSTEASNGRLARVGRIDRRIREVTSQLDACLYACYPRPVNGYLGAIRTAVVLALLLSVAVFFGLAGVLNPPGPPERHPRPGLYVYAIEDDGWVRLYRIERDEGRPRLVPAGPALRPPPRAGTH